MLTAIYTTFTYRTFNFNYSTNFILQSYLLRVDLVLTANVLAFKLSCNTVYALAES